MWLIILLLLAAVAFVVVKIVLKKADPAASPPPESLTPPPAGHNASPAETDNTTRIDTAGTSAAAGAGAVAGTSAAASAGASSDARQTVNNGDAPELSDADIQSLDSKASDYGVNSGDPASDIREMIKILNLRDSDAPRLGIEKDAFNHLAQGSDAGMTPELLSSIRLQLVRWLS